MYHEQGRGASKEKGQLCSLGSGVCPGKLFLPLPLSSLHDVHKTKLLQVTANYYFFFPFSGFPACRLLHYKNVKHIPLHMQVMRSVQVQERCLFVEKLYQNHLNCASKTSILFWH